MRLLIRVSEVPPSINDSYPGYGYFKLGLLHFTYSGGYRGPTHWINAKYQVFEPEYACPEGWEAHFFPGVLAQVIPIPMDKSDLLSMYINGVATNPALGQNMPLKTT